MKAKLSVVIGSLMILVAGHSFGYPCVGGRCGCPPPYGCHPSSRCEASLYPTCDCTDPACGSADEYSCMGQGRCCEAFGNMGAR
jgi:hypothetical protein